MFEELYQQLGSYWFAFLNYLPTLFAGLTVFIFGWILALFTRKLIKIGVRVAGIDVAFNRFWCGKSRDKENRIVQQGWKPSRLIAQAVYWLIIITTLMFTFNMLGLSAAYLFLAGFLAYLPELLIGIVILALGTYISRRAARFSEEFSSSLGITYAHEVAVLVKVTVLSITLLAIGDYLNVLPFISLAGFLVIGGSILISLFVILLICGRPLISAYMARHTLKSFLRPGMLIKFQDKSGRIRMLKNFVTVIESENETIYYPNHKLAELAITQYKSEVKEVGAEGDQD
ncbi:MAG: mechanosensitive ion channel family protein [Bacillota bacterium]